MHQRGNYGNLLSHIFGIKFVKVTVLLNKLLKSWFDKKISLLRENFSFFHTVHCNLVIYYLYRIYVKWILVKCKRFKTLFPHLAVQTLVIAYYRRCTFPHFRTFSWNQVFCEEFTRKKDGGGENVQNTTVWKNEKFTLTYWKKKSSNQVFSNFIVL